MKQHEHRPIAFGEGDIELEQELATDKHTQRKQTPVFSGVVRYFPDSLNAVAQCSLAGNRQHHAYKPLHWDRSKSTDESDALMRHLMQYDELDDDGIWHATKVAWRALALLQKTLEANGEAPLSPYNKKL
jgi:hypothetical protein